MPVTKAGSPGAAPQAQRSGEGQGGALFDPRGIPDTGRGKRRAPTFAAPGVPCHRRRSATPVGDGPDPPDNNRCPPRSAPMAWTGSAPRQRMSPERKDSTPSRLSPGNLLAWLRHRSPPWVPCRKPWRPLHSGLAPSDPVRYQSGFGTGRSGQATCPSAMPAHRVSGSRPAIWATGAIHWPQRRAPELPQAVTPRPAGPTPP